MVEFNKETEGSVAPAGPLNGLRIIELGHFIAAPFAARLLGDLGAEVIKIEPPGAGDPARGWGLASEGQSLWWSLHGRHKKSVTLNLKSAEGREIALKLIAEADGVIENFRPGQLERWGLGPDDIARVNPRCVISRISGYGQSGPSRDKVSFGVIGEAMGGIRHLTAYPEGTVDLPPVRTGVSLADSLAAMYAVIGLLAGIFNRDVAGRDDRRVADVALYEAVFSLLEGCLPEYGKLGVVRAPTGSTLPTNAPSNAYRCEDGKFICIAGNSDRIFRRLAALIGQPELADDARFVDNWSRVSHAAELDGFIGKWASNQQSGEALALLEQNEVPAGAIYTVADCATDEQYLARRMIQEVDDPVLGSMLHPGVVPRFGEATQVAGVGPTVGAHTDEVLASVAGFAPEAISQLREQGVI